MKKILLALAAVSLIASAADAGTGSAAWRFEDLNWRVSQNINGGGADSSAITFGGSLEADTSAAYSLDNLMPNPFITTAAGLDTSLTFSLYMTHDGGVSTLTPAGDSIYVLTQVSLGGSSWTTVTPTATFEATAASGVASSATTAAYVLEQGSSNSFAWPYDVAVRSATTGTDLSFVGNGATAPTDQAIFGYRFVRFIITASDLTGLYRLQIARWRPL